MTKQQMQKGLKISEAMTKSKSLLGSDVILAGQPPDNDINWMQLQTGKDYYKSIGIAKSFRCYNYKSMRYDYFSFSQAA